MQQVTDLWNKTSLISKITFGSLLTAVAFVFVCFFLVGISVVISEAAGQGNNMISRVSRFIGTFGCLFGLGAIVFILPSILIWGFRLFSNRNKKNSRNQLFPLDVQNAFAAIALSVMAVDGHVSGIEIQTVGLILGKKRLFRNYNVDNLALNEILTVLQEQGFEYMIREAKYVLSYDLRETAFTMATDLAVADGYLDEGEQYYLTLLYQLLELPEQTAIKIIDVIEIKNRG